MVPVNTNPGHGAAATCASRVQARARWRRVRTRSGRRAGAPVETPAFPSKPTLCVGSLGGLPALPNTRMGEPPRFAWVARRMLPGALPRPEALAGKRPLTTRKALPCRVFRCAEEDSNLHPVSLDQALNLVTRVPYPSRIAPDRPNRPGIWTIRAHRTIWMLPPMLPQVGQQDRGGRRFKSCAATARWSVALRPGAVRTS